MCQGSFAAVAEIKVPAARSRVVVVGSPAGEHGGRHPPTKAYTGQPTL